MNKKVKILKYFMVILACIAILGQFYLMQDPNESLVGKISIATFGTIGACLFSIMYFIVKSYFKRWEIRWDKI